MDELEPRRIPTRCTSWSCACTPTRCHPTWGATPLLQRCTIKPVTGPPPKKGYLTELISLRLQLISSYSDFSPAAATQKSSYPSPSLCEEKPCGCPHPAVPPGAVREGMVGPRTSAALRLMNLTAYTSEETLVQIVPLSGAGLVVHPQGLSAGRASPASQVFAGAGCSPHPTAPFAGRLTVPAGWGGGFQVGQNKPRCTAPR